MNTLGLKDFSEKIQKGFVETDLNLDIIREKINDNFSKGKIDVNEFCEANDIIDSFEKARGPVAAVGEIRQFGGKSYIKTATSGWILHSEGRSEKTPKTTVSTEESPRRKKYEAEWNARKLRLANKYGGYDKVPRAEIKKLQDYLGDKYRDIDEARPRSRK